MHKYKYYLTTILYSDINSLYDNIVNNNIKKFGFIMLIIKKNKNFGHFVACYCDFKNELTCEYYDPFGDDPPDNLFIDFIKKLINNFKFNRLIKIKINKIKHESFSSSLCAWYCIKFILSRFNNIWFIRATKYHKIKDNEENIKKMKNHYNKFGFI